jgi:uncharacterized membrane protein YbhN (UPF0104 family)
MNSSGGRSRRAVIVTFTVGVPLSLVFLWLSVRGVDLRAVGRTIAEARPVPIVAAAILIGVMYGLQARRWRRIARSSLPQIQVLEMLVASLAVNNVVPGRVGDLLRANWIARASGVPGGRGLASVVLDRGCDLLVLAASLFVFLPLVSHTAWVDRLVAGAGVVVALFLFGLGALRLYVHRRRRPVSRQGLIRRLADDTALGLSEPMPNVDKLALLGLSVAAWVAWSVAAILCARSIGVELGLAEALFLAGAVNLGALIPSTPGYVGTYQWLVVSTLALYGIGRDDGLAFAVVFQACWYIPTTIVGGILLVLRSPSSARISASAIRPAGQSARARA